MPNISILDGKWFFILVNSCFSITPFLSDSTIRFSDSNNSRLARVAAQQTGLPPCVLFNDRSTSINSDLPRTADNGNPDEIPLPQHTKSASTS